MRFELYKVTKLGQRLKVSTFIHQYSPCTVDYHLVFLIHELSFEDNQALIQAFQVFLA